ncbi:MAG TPA: peptidylprolyl isomerase [Chitinophagaceae bacterium]|jgi:peptidylprolyl isomerase|nr:peptidylprolyl isomerase [Chitinophagaceae bacterium]
MATFPAISFAFFLAGKLPDADVCDATKAEERSESGKHKKTTMQQVKTGDTVKVHYHGRLTNGETFDTSSGREPLEFEVGSGAVIKGFDEGVMGMSVGDKKTINIPVEDAYGPVNPEMLIEYPKDRFPTDMEIEVGMPLMMSNGAGQNFQVVVTDIKDDVVTLDANHPLAGQDLIFEIELVEIAGGSPLIIMP